jgi:hypothetical protein
MSSALCRVGMWEDAQYAVMENFGDGYLRYDAKKEHKAVYPTSVPEERRKTQSALVDTTMHFYDSTDRPPNRRNYDVTIPDDLEDLSIRVLGISGERLKHTMLVSSGLLLENTGTPITRSYRSWSSQCSHEFISTRQYEKQPTIHL